MRAAMSVAARQFRISRRWARQVCTALAFTLPLQLAPALAQDAEETLGEEDMPQATLLGEAGYAYQSEADIDGGGSMQANRFDIGFIGRSDLGNGFRWTNTFFFAVNDYDFSGTGDPWGTILIPRLVSKLNYRINEHWGISAGGVFMFSPETGAEWGDSFTGGGLVGVDYRAGKTFFVSLGVAGLSQIEDDATVAPSVIMLWLPHRDWSVRIGAVPATGGAAAAAEVAYRIAEPVELGLGLLYNQRRFRLDDSGVAPDGVGEDDNLPLRLRLGWHIIPEISLHLLGGVALSGEVQLDDSNGNRIAKSDYDPAAYVGLRFVGGY